MSAPPGRRDRRGLLLFVGLGAVALALPQLWQARRGAGPLKPHPTMPGLWMTERGLVSQPVALAGLGTAGPQNLPAPQPVPAGGLCTALYGAAAPAGAPALAAFTDINCPLCREMDPAIAAQAAAGVTVVWHDLPLLGPPSLTAARLIAAARLQDPALGAEVRLRLQTQAFPPGAAGAARLAADLPLDPQRLARDAESAAATAAVARTLGLARALGVGATPAVVAGDALAIGRLTDRNLAALVADRAMLRPDCA